jgi:hypothetical protein
MKLRWLSSPTFVLVIFIDIPSYRISFFY